MKTSSRIRIIIGTTALVLWAVVIVHGLLFLHGHGDRLVWQLNNWAVLFAPVFTMVYIIMLTIHIYYKRHWDVQVIGWFTCVIVVLLCLVVFFVAGVRLNPKIWGNKDYVVYSEYGGFTDPDVYVIYKRDGLIDRQMYILDCEGLAFPFVLGDDNFGGLHSATYYVHDSINLLQCEAEIKSPLQPDSLFHRTVFYRLDDGLRFAQDHNDSLFARINHDNQSR